MANSSVRGREDGRPQLGAAQSAPVLLPCGVDTREWALAAPEPSPWPLLRQGRLRCKTRAARRVPWGRVEAALSCQYRRLREGLKWHPESVKATHRGLAQTSTP